MLEPPQEYSSASECPDFARGIRLRHLLQNRLYGVQYHQTSGFGLFLVIGSRIRICNPALVPGRVELFIRESSSRRRLIVMLGRFVDLLPYPLKVRLINNLYAPGRDEQAETARKIGL